MGRAGRDPWDGWEIETIGEDLHILGGLGERMRHMHHGRPLGHKTGRAGGEGEPPLYVKVSRDTWFQPLPIPGESKSNFS